MNDIEYGDFQEDEGVPEVPKSLAESLREKGYNVTTISSERMLELLDERDSKNCVERRIEDE